jgi:hypothetical protein
MRERFSRAGGGFLHAWRRHPQGVEKQLCSRGEAVLPAWRSDPPRVEKRFPMPEEPSLQGWRSGSPGQEERSSTRGEAPSHPIQIAPSPYLAARPAVIPSPTACTTPGPRRRCSR